MLEYFGAKFSLSNTDAGVLHDQESKFLHDMDQQKMTVFDQKLNYQNSPELESTCVSFVFTHISDNRSEFQCKIRDVLTGMNIRPLPDEISIKSVQMVNGQPAVEESCVVQTEAV